MRRRAGWRRGHSAGVTGVLVVVLVAFSARYGYHRDELYFLAAGHHLAWGYPDQPPLTPFLAWVMNGLGHGSLVVFRLPATLAAAGVTLLTALMARELGGGRFAQVLAAVTVAMSTYVLLSGHLLVTSTVDLLVWVTVTWLVVRILRPAARGCGRACGRCGRRRSAQQAAADRPAAGALLVGVLLTPSARPLLRSRWLLAGCVVAAVMWTPVLVWQAQHGWPQLTLAGQIRDEYGAAGERLNFFFLQLALFSAGAAYLWVVGLRALWRRDEWRTYRVLVWTWLFVLVLLRAHRRAGLLPSRHLSGPHRRRLRGHRGQATSLAGRRPVVGSSVLFLRCRAPGAVPLRPRRLTLERARRDAARDRWLAAPGRPGGEGVRLDPGRPAQQRDDLRHELRRGRRHRPVRREPRAAARLERAQRVRPVGTAARGRWPGRGDLGGRCARRRTSPAATSSAGSPPRCPTRSPTALRSTSARADRRLGVRVAPARPPVELKQPPRPRAPCLPN